MPVHARRRTRPCPCDRDRRRVTARRRHCSARERRDRADCPGSRPRGAAQPPKRALVQLGSDQDARLPGQQPDRPSASSRRTPRAPRRGVAKAPLQGPRLAHMEPLGVAWSHSRAVQRRMLLAAAAVLPFIRFCLRAKPAHHSQAGAARLADPSGRSIVAAHPVQPHHLLEQLV